MTKETAKAFFTSAEIEVLDMWELMNQYWPRNGERYIKRVIENPWWLVKTNMGLIQIGRRKRVTTIDWSDTRVRKEITTDDVTKSKTMVHAWGNDDVVKYLINLKVAFEKLDPVTF